MRIRDVDRSLRVRRLERRLKVNIDLTWIEDKGSAIASSGPKKGEIERSVPRRARP